MIFKWTLNLENSGFARHIVFCHIMRKSSTHSAIGRRHFPHSHLRVRRSLQGLFIGPSGFQCRLTRILRGINRFGAWYVGVFFFRYVTLDPVYILDKFQLATADPARPVHPGNSTEDGRSQPQTIKPAKRTNLGFKWPIRSGKIRSIGENGENIGENVLKTGKISRKRGKYRESSRKTGKMRK